MNNLDTTQRNIFFNRGQRLTPEHLNAISDFSVARDALTAKALIGHAGIIQGFGENFAVCLNDDGYLCVAPGVAINDKGELLVLDKPTVCSLKNLAPSEATTYYVQLVSKNILEEAYKDPEYEELEGYRYRRTVASIEVSKNLLPGAVEIARVLVNEANEDLSTNVDPTSIESAPGIIDTRHAKRIHLYTSNLLSFEQHFKIKKITLETRNILEELGPLYPQLQGVSTALDQIVRLQAEVQEPVLQAHKVNFWLSELRKSLLSLTESARYLVAGYDEKSSRSDFWTLLLETVDRISNPRGAASYEEFLALATTNNTLKDNLLKVRANDEQRMLVLESIKAVKHIAFGHHKAHSFAGSLYEQMMGFDADRINLEGRKETEFSTMMTVKAQFDQESLATYKGFFTSKGKLHLALPELKAGLDTVIVWQLYKRRGALQYQVQFNAKDIFSESLKANDHIGRMLNIGTCVPGSMLSGSENVLTFDIPQADMDFGLFGLWVYQVKGVNA